MSNQQPSPATLARRVAPDACARWAGALLTLGLLLLAGCADDEPPAEDEASARPPVVEAPPAAVAPAEPGSEQDDGRAGVDEELDDELAAALEDEPSELATLAEAAQEHDVDADLVAALAWHESRWDHSARSPAGAVGVLQVMPSTAERVSDRLGEPLDPTDVEDNAAAGAAYLAGLKSDFETTRRALIAYNMGSAQLRDEGPLASSEEFAERVLDTRDQLAQVDWEPVGAEP